MADRLLDFVKEKSNTIANKVHENVISVTDTTGALAKQKLLQHFIASGVLRSEQIRDALQIGILHFLTDQYEQLGSHPEYVQRAKFPAAGSENTPAHSQTDFDIEAYGLEIFNSLMFVYGINRQVLRGQIAEGKLREIANPASSGSMLFLTANSSFLIKTVRDYDAKFMQQKFLSDYLNYVHKTPGTFIAKLFGSFGYIPHLSQHASVAVDSFTLRFAIYSNCIPTELEIHEKYDLKGSSYRRDAGIAEKQKSSATFKDNDFRDIHPEGFTLPRSVYYHLEEVLTRDVEFLKALNIMDYSLLLTVHNMDNQEKPTSQRPLETLLSNFRDTFLVGMTDKNNREQNASKTENKKSILKFNKPIETLAMGFKEISTYDTQNAKEFGGIPAINEKGERVLLFLGIIDILQTFDLCKVMQRRYQTVENPQVVEERSIVEPEFYAKRFKEFLFQRVFRPADDELSTHPVSMNVFRSSDEDENSTGANITRF